MAQDPGRVSRRDAPAGVPALTVAVAAHVIVAAVACAVVAVGVDILTLPALRSLASAGRSPLLTLTVHCGSRVLPPVAELQDGVSGDPRGELRVDGVSQRRPSLRFARATYGRATQDAPRRPAGVEPQLAL